METPESLSSYQSVKNLHDHYAKIQSTHLRELLSDGNRNNSLVASFEDIIIDYSHEKLNEETLTLLEALSEELRLKDRFQAMFRGDKINTTENRSVLHVALRKPETEKLEVDGNDVIPEIHKVLKRIKEFSDSIRSILLLNKVDIR